MRLSRADLTPLVEQVKQAIALPELAAELGLEPPAHGGLWRCPWHADGSPSLSIRERTFRCFGCGVAGDCLALLQRAQGWSFRESLEYLAGRLGLPLPWQAKTRRALPPLKVAAPPPAEPEPPTIDPERRSTILTSFCEAARIRESATPTDHPGLAYLAGRGISPVTARAARLAYVTDYRRASDWLAARFSLDELKASGLFSPRGTLRTYRHRLLLPYWLGGQVVGLQARDCDGGQPKELSLGPVLAPFGADVLLGEPAEVHVTEGVLDCLSLLELGLPAVAVPGVHGFKPAWVKLFEGWRVTLAFDADEPGRRATERVAAMFAAEGQAVQALTLPPDCKDVNELLLRKAA